MSRRMLLEDDYRENGLTPVMDGLVCWLDGRDYVAGENMWKDRVTKKEYPIQNVISNNKNIEVNSSYVDYIHENDYIFIEVNHVPVSYDFLYLIDTKTIDDRRKYCFISRQMILRHNFYHFLNNLTNDNRITLNNAYQTCLASTVLNNNFTLLSRHTINEFYQGYINSIRIYNRQLSKEEIQQNYLYELSIERGE